MREKNKRRLNYPQYRAGKWLCGSGIIESGVRRRDQSAVQVGIVFLEPRKSGWLDISALRLAFREMEICHANYYKFLNEGGQIAIAPPPTLVGGCVNQQKTGFSQTIKFYQSSLVL